MKQRMYTIILSIVVCTFCFFYFSKDRTEAVAGVSNSNIKYNNKENRVSTLFQKYMIEAIVKPIFIKNDSQQLEQIQVEIEDVPIIAQMPELPTGCEITAATMLLRWSGMDVDKVEMAKKMPKGSAPAYRKNKMIGDNPNKTFIGDPFHKSGFGVYHKPIADLINDYLPNHAQDITGSPFSSILETVKSGRPIIVWITRDLRQTKKILTWYDKDNNEVVWKSPEHTVVLIGYTDTHIIVNEPYVGKKVYYSIQEFKNSWELMGSQAVTLSE